jgi:hypothetical protein
MRRFDALELSGIRKLRPGLSTEADHHPGRMRRSAISTTRLAGGLLCAYKARVTGQALKGPLNERSPSAPLSLAQALARAFVICCPCLLAHP